MNNTKRSKEKLKPFSLGKVFVVATPIGNLKDITYRAVEVLQEVDLIACEDTRQTRKLLDNYGIKTKCVIFHEHSNKAQIDRIISDLAEGKNIALVSDAGTPLISDPGHPLISRAIDEGVIIHPIPGACAAISALSCSGINADNFTFLGFLPSTLKARKEKLSRVIDLDSSLILYESPRRISALLNDILEILGDRHIVIARELTKIYEEFKRGKVSEVIELIGDLKGECVVIIEGATSREVSEKEIIDNLTQAMKEMTMKDSVDFVASSLNLPRKKVYKLGLSIRNL